MSISSIEVLSIHGAGAGGWEWALWRAVFEARGARLHAPDLQPARDVVATRYEDYLSQVRAALSALPRPRALVGASLGGLLVAEAAADADALILVNPLPPAPWHAALPARTWPERVAWGRDARLASTRAAMPDADPASALRAMRGWRDEAGAVLQAAWDGRPVRRPAMPVLCIASRDDGDVPPTLTRALADAWGADFAWSGAGSHVGPLLGRHAVETARYAHDWLRARCRAGTSAASV